MATPVTTYLTNPLVFTAAAKAIDTYRDYVVRAGVGGGLPDAVRQWLARLRLLEGVPFAHLVPDSELLPPESIRFFYIDREWTDALVQGALSVSTITTLDREQLQSVHARLREEIDGEERRVRMVGGEDLAFGAAGQISGFLLRSRAVSGWPALHVRAYNVDVKPDDVHIDDADARRVRLLRLERLAPAVLFCLFDGVPEVVHVEEPRQGVQFGIKLLPEQRIVVELRDVETAAKLKVGNEPVLLDVPFRKDAPGVINVAELAKQIAAQPATHVADFEAPGVQSAEFAIEMLQFPYRQVFGAIDPASVEKPPTLADVFNPTIGLEDL
jgi:hypothetical protein